MLIISRAFRPSEPVWQLITMTTVHRTVPGPGELPALSVAPGTTIWTPPFPCVVRAFTVNSDEADPITSPDGGTTYSTGITGPVATGGQLAFTTATVFSGLGTRLNGHGHDGPGIAAATGIGVADAGITLFPVGALLGRPTLFRHIGGVTNSGTAVGTLHFRFEMRAFPGAWT